MTPGTMNDMTHPIIQITIRHKVPQAVWPVSLVSAENSLIFPLRLLWVCMGYIPSGFEQPLQALLLGKKPLSTR